MPKFAHLAERVLCPQCGADLAHIDRIGFQWGYCPYPYSDSNRDSYKTGDSLLWRTDANGRVPAWRYFDDGTANIGDPRDGNVVIREGEFEISRCLKCSWAFGAIGILVRDGRIDGVQAFPDWPSGVEVIVVGACGQLIPRPDWTDRPMALGTAIGQSVRLLPSAAAVAVVDPAD